MSETRTGSDWTDDRIQTMMTLWHDGKSAAEIAGVLGTTRSAIIGKVHRVEIAQGKRIRPENRRGPKRGYVRKAAPSEPSVPAIAKAEPEAPKRRELKPPQVKMPSVAGGEMCSIIDLTGCKWPVEQSDLVGGHLFCNAARKIDAPYCDYHAAMSVGGSAPSKPWNSNDDNQVRAFWNGGQGKHWLGTKLQRSLNHIALRARQLGLVRT